MRPLDDRVVLEIDSAETQSPGGIVLPDMAKEKPTRGTVVAVGPGRLMESGVRVPCVVAVGDKVIFARYGGVEIEQHGKQLTIMREGDILAKL